MTMKKEKGFCNNCRTWNMELPESPQTKPGELREPHPDWLYVACGGCGVPRHLRDVIDSGIEEAAKIAGRNNMTKAIN